MDKVNGSSHSQVSQWERKSASRGHRSAVDGALRAHRQRAQEREARVQERLSMVKGMQSQFFSGPSIQNRSARSMDPLQGQNNLQNSLNINNPIPNRAVELESQAQIIDDIQGFSPRAIDDIYSEAQLGTAGDSALALVEKEIANPDEGPMSDMPKGSYIDYTV